MSENEAGKEMSIMRSLCNYCGACAGMCPTDAFSMEEASVTIWEEKCIKCGFCIVGCPIGAVTSEWFHEEL